MASNEKDDSYSLLGLDPTASPSDIQRAYRRLALQCHPERGDNKDKLVAKFEEINSAYKSLTADDDDDEDDDSDVDGEQIFFNHFKDVLSSRTDGCSPHVDDMCIEDDDESDSGEKDFDAFVDILSNCRKKGKPIPDGFTHEELTKLREALVEDRENSKRENAKKQTITKVKAPNQVPVSKPKPKSKKQKAAEQRRREKEMEAIADEIAEKNKLEEERAEKKKQAELEKQKRQEEERARLAAEEQKRREKEAEERAKREAQERKEREEKERVEREKREKEEEESRLKEEEDKRKKEEKKKKAAAAKQKQLAEQKAKEEEAKKQQAAKQRQVQQQQQRSYPPREVPPRFAQKQQQQKQQKMQQQQQAVGTAPKKSATASLAPGSKKTGLWPGSGSWGEEEGDSGWSQVNSTGSGWTDPDAGPHQSDSHEIGTWNPEAPAISMMASVGSSVWGASATSNSNDIIVDTKDKEAWPSIGDQSESNSDNGDNDNASVKSGSVISCSSNPGQASQGQGQGQNDTGQGSSAMQGQSASSVWGASNPGDDSVKDSNATWGCASPGTANMNSGGWGTPQTSANNPAVNNHGLNMQSNQNSPAMGGDISASNPLTSSAYNPNSLGWGMNTTASMGSNNGPQNAMQAQPGRGNEVPTSIGAHLENNGPVTSGSDIAGSTMVSGNNAMSWQSINNFGLTGLQQGASANQDSGWGSLSRGNSVIGSGLGIASQGSAADNTMDTATSKAVDSNVNVNSSVDNWGSTPSVATGWGTPSPCQPKAEGWGSPTPSPNPNAGTEGWGTPDKRATAARTGGEWGQPDTKVEPQGWGQPEIKTSSTQGWGQSEVKPSSAQGWGQGQGGQISTAQGWALSQGQAQQVQQSGTQGWGQVEQKPNPTGWGQPDIKPNPATGWPVQQMQNKHSAPSGWEAKSSTTGWETKPNPTGWGDKPPESRPNSGWGEANKPSNPSSGWGDTDVPKTSSTASGWGQSGAGGNTPTGSWGQPNSKPNTTSNWGQPDNRQNPPSHWVGSGSGSNPQAQWGNSGSSAPPSGPQGAWGRGNPITNANPNVPKPGSMGGSQQGPPSTWAQAAGKGLNTSSVGNVANKNTAANTGSHFGDAPPPDSKMHMAMTSEGWGKRPIRQDTPWDTYENSSPAENRRKGSTASNDSSSHWNSTNINGTAIWEASKESSGSGSSSSSSAGAAWGSSSGAGASGSSEWHSDNDSNTWNGPPPSGPPPPNQSSNTWSGPPPPKNSGNNQWGNQPSDSGMKENTWSGGSSAGSSNNHQSSTWNSNDNRPSANTWGGNQAGASQASNNQWQNISSWGGSGNYNRSERNDSSSWGETESGNWGDTSRKSSESGSWGDNGHTEMGTWGHSSGNKSSSSSWGDPAETETLVGWEDPSSPANRRNVDNGTAFWGDPSNHNQSKPKNWSNPSTPSTPLTPHMPQPPNMSCPPPNMKPDDRSSNANVWGVPPTQPPPSGTPSIKSSGWGDPSPGARVDDGTNIWSQQGQQQNKQPNWNDNQWNGGGAKPKNSSTSSWGDPAEWNANTAKKPGEGDRSGPANWEDSSNNVWEDMGDWEGNSQENSSSWSSAQGWNKMTKRPKGSNFGMGVKQQPPQMRSKMLQQLMDMGFKREDAQNALISNNMNFESAIGALRAAASKQTSDIMDSQKMIRKSHGFGDDVGEPPSDVNTMVPPISMQNTPQFPNAQSSQLANSQAIANSLKPQAQGPSLQTPSSLGGLSTTSITNPSLQQKILQQQLASAAQQNPTQGQPIRGQISNQSMQQQLVQQQIVHQLRMAVQAGLINPQLLNKQLTPNMLVMLQQLLQLQNVLQRLVAQQQMIQQQRPLNVASQRQQLEQLAIMIQKIKQQIYQQQQQIAQAQQQLTKPQTFDGAMPVEQNPLKSLQSEFSNLGLKDVNLNLKQHQVAQQQQQQQQQQSRLTQWKLSSPDKDSDPILPSAVGDLGLNKAVGSKPLHQSHSTPNMQSKLEFGSGPFGDSTWSNQGSSTATREWPKSNISIMTSSHSDAKDPITLDSSKDSLSTSSASTAAATAANFNINDMIAEFVPGKPWQGMNTKSIEDDPHITPGSVTRSLSVNTIKDDYVSATLGKSTSPAVTMDTSTSSSWSSSFGSLTKPAPSGSKSSAWTSTTDTTLASDLWGVGFVPKNTRPPPGLSNQGKNSMWHPNSINRSVSWAGGDRTTGGSTGGTTTAAATGGSGWLVLKNLTPQIDGSTLKTLCMQHGPLLTFHLNHGQALVCYSTREEAIKAQKSLNTCVLGNTTILAEFATDADIARFYELKPPATTPTPGGAPPSQGSVVSQGHTPTSSLSSLWSQQSQSNNYRSSTGSQFTTGMSSKVDTTSQWNGTNLGGFHSGVWGTGGGSLWGTPSLDEHHVDHSLLPGDLLGGQSM